MEDVATWLCSPRVSSFAGYKFDTSNANISSKAFSGGRGEDSTCIKGKIANRIEKMAAVWPILGGGVMQERSCTNFTVEFQSDHSRVRQQLAALHAQFQDGSKRWLFPHDKNRKNTPRKGNLLQR